MPCGQKVGWDPEEHSAKDINLINNIFTLKLKIYFKGRVSLIS